MLKIAAKNLDNVAILSLMGRIVTAETEDLRNAVLSQAAGTTLILDLSNVTTVDAHGLGVLLDLRQKSLANGNRFKLMNVSQPLSQVFEITRLNTVFEMTAKVEYIPVVSRGRHAPVAA